MNKKSKTFTTLPQDHVFSSHIAYLTQISCFNLNQSNKNMIQNNVIALKKLTNKKALKLNTDIKFLYCKRCKMMLISGVNCKIRTKSNIYI